MQRTHAYLKRRNVEQGRQSTLAKDASERVHLEQINHFAEKRSAEIYAKTPQEKLDTLTAIRRYPNRNHKPVG